MAEQECLGPLAEEAEEEDLDAEAGLEDAEEQLPHEVPAVDAVKHLQPPTPSAEKVSKASAAMEQLKRSSLMAEALLQAAGEADALMAAEQQREQEKEEAKRRHLLETEALFQSLESLAEAAANLVLRGAPQEAVDILQMAIDDADAQAEAEVESDSESEESGAALQPVAIARLGAQVLLCSALSQVGQHSEALEVAREAMAAADALLVPQLEKDEEASDVVEEASRSATATAKSQRLLLRRNVELAVQARQCQAVELEFMQPHAEAMPGAAGEASHEPPAARTAGEVHDELAVLHRQAAQLARQFLPAQSAVRTRAEKALREWQLRSAAAAACAEMSSLDGSTGLRPMSQVSSKARALAALRASTPSKSDPGTGLPKHERMYLGIPPPIDMQHERRRRRPGGTTSRPMTATSNMSSLDFAEGAPSQDSLNRSTSAPTLMLDRLGSSGSLAGSDSLQSPLSLPCPDFWGKDSVKLGDLYNRSSPHSSQLPKSSPSWSSLRRAPCLFSMTGPGGKANWALRRATSRKRSDFERQKINAFEDWRKNASGPKVNLKDQVLQTDSGIVHFADQLKHESQLFKHFWLKDEVTADDLWEDRTLYCGEGLRVLKKNPLKQLRPVSPATKNAQTLFRHFGVSCPNTGDLAASHAGMPAYGKLLEKSQEHMKKMHMPKARSHRFDVMPVKEHSEFASLKGLISLKM